MFDTDTLDTLAHFKYTRILRTRPSSNVDGAYYNENDKALAVDLNDRVYVYKNVPADVVAAFEKASSAGKFFGREIKSKFGPGEFLGYEYDVDFEQTEASMVAPASATVNAGPYLSLHTAEPANAGSSGPHLSMKAPEPVATPASSKSVTFASLEEAEKFVTMAASALGAEVGEVVVTFV